MMSDRLTKEQRHKNMSAIRGKNTKPELLVRKFLFSRGFRYRLNHPRLPGHPDLVLRKYRTVIFVNAVFGMAMMDANILYYRKQIQSFGRTKSRKIKVVTLKNKKNWLLWDGTVLLYGNVN